MLIVITYATIFTTILMLFSDSNISTSIILLITFVMLIGGSYLKNTASMNEYYYGCFYSDGKLVEATISGKNSFFPGEEKQKIYKTILYFIPTGNAIMMSNKLLHIDPDIEHRSDYNNTMILLSSISEIFIFTAIGMSIFNKKQLK